MMDLETRVISKPLEVRKQGDDVFIEGYGAVFFNPADAGTQYELWTDYYERVMPGAFDEAMKRPDDVRCLFNHNVNVVLGRSKSGTLSLSVDQVGLLYSCKLPNSEWGRSLVESIQRGDVSGCSFSFRAEKTVWREEGDKTYREIESVRLYDVGPVTFPAYESTDVSIAKRSFAEFAKSSKRHRTLADVERDRRIQAALKTK